ncbi:hypothetical protein D3C81_1707400 [compost metagenome]
MICTFGNHWLIHMNGLLGMRIDRNWIYYNYSNCSIGQASIRKPTCCMPFCRLFLNILVSPLKISDQKTNIAPLSSYRHNVIVVMKTLFYVITSLFTQRSDIFGNYTFPSKVSLGSCNGCLSNRRGLGRGWKRIVYLGYVYTGSREYPEWG